MYNKEIHLIIRFVVFLVYSVFDASPISTPRLVFLFHAAFLTWGDLAVQNDFLWNRMFLLSLY
jgi:hypothetical protein